MDNWFPVLALVLSMAAMAGWLARMIKQPAILGYITAGILFSLTGYGKTGEMKLFVDSMGQMGVTLLLFLAGLELPLAELKKTGRVSLMAGMGQIAITAMSGYWLCRLLGFQPATAIYIGIGMAFASTILVVKLMSERGDLQSLHGKLALGLLLVQDFVAIGLLAVAGGPATGNFQPAGYLLILVKSVLLVGIAVWLSERVMGKIMGFLAKSTELVFIGSLGWCLLCAAVVSLPVIGFTREIGGFLAGMALAGAMEQAQIISRVRPLRDFFLTWFFVGLGAGITIDNLHQLWLPVTAISAYVLIINPLILTLILNRMGYTIRTAFLTGLAITQVSEFSLIMAMKAGLDSRAMNTVTLVMILTMTVSTYLIWNSARIYRKLAPILRKLDVKRPNEEHVDEEMKNHIILFGHNRVGRVVYPVLEKTGMPVLVVDFNPKIVEQLTEKNKKAVYGDMADHELYERLCLDKARLIISTVPDFYDNQELLGEIRMKPKRRPFIILTASDQEDARRLYGAGADYVLVPHSVGAEFLADYLKKHWHA